MATIFKGYMSVNDHALILEAVDDVTGARDTSYGPITIELGPLITPAGVGPGHSNGLVITLRETKGCDEDGNPKYATFLRSEWYDDPLTTDYLE